ncbi:DUF6000 family protein [Spirillospora sp. NPDC046719]
MRTGGPGGPGRSADSVSISAGIALSGGLPQPSCFRQAPGQLLLESELPYAGQGYCLVLARFGQPEDAEFFVLYLDRYLPQRLCYYDQDWALGGLLHLDAKLGTNHAGRFLAADGLWHRSAFAGTDPAECRRFMDERIQLADQAMGPHK